MIIIIIIIIYRGEERRQRKDCVLLFNIVSIELDGEVCSCDSV